MSFTLNTPTDPENPLNRGGSIWLDGQINYSSIDQTPVNNRFGLKLEVVNSFDPNDKKYTSGSEVNLE